MTERNKPSVILNKQCDAVFQPEFRDNPRYWIGTATAMTSPKTIMITDASRGLGLATATKLAHAGHTIILCSHSIERGQQPIAQIRQILPNAIVELRELNPASFQSIHTFAADVLQDNRIIDVLIHNAGILQPPRTRRTTPEGLEETLAVNVLGPFLITKLLLPALERSVSARVVAVSSCLHIPGVRGPPPAFRLCRSQLDQ